MSNSKIACLIATIVALAACSTISTPILVGEAGAHPPKQAEVEVIRRDQLGFYALDNGRTRVLYTASLGEPGGVGYQELGPLLVFAYDEVQPGSGFKLHSHENVESITIVLEGSYDHDDTAGYSGRVKAGEVSLMSAGKGIKHAEIGNPDVLTRSVTIWLKPRTMNKVPAHVTAKIVNEEGWQLIAGEHDAPLIVEQDARILMKRLAAHQQVPLIAPYDRMIYLAVVEGEVVTDGQRLSVPERIILRDGQISIASDGGATVVVVDVPLAKR